MNTANLQLEGLYVAIAGLIELIKDKRLASAEEVDATLARAEQSAFDGKDAGMSAANLAAISFPIRLLRLSNTTSFAGRPLPFQELTRRVGEAKDRNSALSEEELLQLASTLERDRDA